MAFLYRTRFSELHTCTRSGDRPMTLLNSSFQQLECDDVLFTCLKHFTLSRLAVLDRKALCGTPV